MPTDNLPSPDNHAEQFEIRVKGHLDPSWSDCFEGLSVSITQGGETVLSGPIMDQAALHGILARIRDMNLPLLYVARISGPGPPGETRDSDARCNQIIP